MTSRTIAALAAFVSLVLPAIAVTPVPAVRGPLPVTATSYPFGAADHPMKPEDLKPKATLKKNF